MNTSQKLSRDWRTGFQKNVFTLIGIGIIIALVGVFFGVIVSNILSPHELAGYERTFGFDMFALSRFVLYGGLGLVVLGVFMYIITRTVKPSD